MDVLVEEAKMKAVEVENKVASANIFAEQVGVEKEKVNAENAAAQIEAEKCAVIAKEVSEKQSSCEADLAAAEPLVAEAMAALETVTKKDLGEAKSLKKPPPGVDDITAVVICLLDNNPKDKSWAAAQKMMNNVDKFLERVKSYKSVIDAGQVCLSLLINPAVTQKLRVASKHVVAVRYQMVVECIFSSVAATLQLDSI